MKRTRINKVLGVALGERSLLAAEVVSGERPEVRRLAEMIYSEGLTPVDPQALGTALGEFLRDNKFTARSAVFGLPARWLVVKAKEVPPTDPATLANLLRLQAEGEFSSELKDLIYDYAADTSAGNPKCVLLIATSKKYIDGVNTICEAAKLSPLVVTSSAVALGVMTGRSVEAKNPLVLLVSPSGAELTAQSGETSNAIRHMPGPGADRPFVGELRRAILGMPPAGGPGANGTPRELVLWDGAGTEEVNAGTLGQNLGLHVRCGDLPIFGVDATPAAANGEGRKYAAAVALGLLAVADRPAPVDFLHSRLAPPKPPLVPRWVMISSLAAIAVIALSIWAYSYMQKQQGKLDKINASNAAIEKPVIEAKEFVDKVSFAQAWHLGNPRYLACLTDLTNSVPLDQQTYAVSLSVHEVLPEANNSAAPGTAAHQAVAGHQLTGILEGRTSEQRRVLQLLNEMKTRSKVFSEVKLVDSRDQGTRSREVSFTISFNYTPPKAP